MPIFVVKSKMNSSLQVHTIFTQTAMLLNTSHLMLPSKQATRNWHDITGLYPNKMGLTAPNTQEAFWWAHC